jgi:hypothetical protein
MRRQNEIGIEQLNDLIICPAVYLETRTTADDTVELTII